MANFLGGLLGLGGGALLSGLQSLFGSNDNNDKNISEEINKFLNAPIDEKERRRQIALLNQMIEARRAQEQQRFQQNLAFKTAGRLGAVSGRALPDIGGQFALAQQQGLADIEQQLLVQQRAKQLAGLQALMQLTGIQSTEDIAKMEALSKLLGQIGSVGGELATLI